MFDTKYYNYFIQLFFLITMKVNIYYFASVFYNMQFEKRIEIIW